MKRVKKYYSTRKAFKENKKLVKKAEIFTKSQSEATLSVINLIDKNYKKKFKNNEASQKSSVISLSNDPNNLEIVINPFFDNKCLKKSSSQFLSAIRNNPNKFANTYELNKLASEYSLSSSNFKSLEGDYSDLTYNKTNTLAKMKNLFLKFFKSKDVKNGSDDMCYDEPILPKDIISEKRLSHMPTLTSFQSKQSVNTKSNVKLSEHSLPLLSKESDRNFHFSLFKKSFEKQFSMNRAFILSIISVMLNPLIGVFAFWLVIEARKAPIEVNQKKIKISLYLSTFSIMISFLAFVFFLTFLLRHHEIDKSRLKVLSNDLKYLEPSLNYS